MSEAQSPVYRVHLHSSAITQSIDRPIALDPLMVGEVLKPGDFFFEGKPRQGAEIFQFIGAPNLTRINVSLVLGDHNGTHTSHPDEESSHIGEGWTVLPNTSLKRASGAGTENTDSPSF